MYLCPTNSSKVLRKYCSSQKTQQPLRMWQARYNVMDCHSLQSVRSHLGFWKSSVPRWLMDQLKLHILCTRLTSTLGFTHHTVFFIKRSCLLPALLIWFSSTTLTAMVTHAYQGQVYLLQCAMSTISLQKKTVPQDLALSFMFCPCQARHSHRHSSQYHNTFKSVITYF